MPKRRSLAAALVFSTIVLAGALGCAGSRTVVLEASVAARIEPGPGVNRPVCARAPCEWTFSRETCVFFDSSSKHFGLVAVADDGREIHSPMFETCSVKPRSKIRFRFASDAGPCAVELIEADTLVRSFSCAP